MENLLTVLSAVFRVANTRLLRLLCLNAPPAITSTSPRGALSSPRQVFMSNLELFKVGEERCIRVQT